MSYQIPENLLKVNITAEEYFTYKESLSRRLYLYGEIAAIDEDEYSFEGGLITTLNTRIMEYNRIDKGKDPKKRDPIYLFIDSVGGDTVEGFSLISMMKVSQTPIYTVNMGQWSSMAFLIGIAGNKRFSLPYASFLMHDGTSIAVGSSNKVQDRMDFEKRFEREVVKEHVLAHSNLSPIDYDALARIELYMFPDEALERGFIDEIVNNIDEIYIP